MYKRIKLRMILQPNLVCGSKGLFLFKNSRNWMLIQYSSLKMKIYNTCNLYKFPNKL